MADSATLVTPTTHHTLPKAPPRKRVHTATPDSAENNVKKTKQLSTDDVNRLVCQQQGMDYQAIEEVDTSIDKQGMMEVMLQRVNDAMKDVKTIQTEDQGTAISVNSLLQNVLPEIMKCMINVVADKIDTTMGKWMEKMEAKRDKEIMTLAQRYETSSLKLKFENDALQQYTRRESVKIFGLTERSGETAEQVEERALKVMEDAGMTVTSDDLHAVHRSGKIQRGKTRPVLVKFISRRKKKELMQKKKTLKEAEGYDNIYIHEDLTLLRSKMLKFIKDHKTDLRLKGAWTAEGKIFAQPDYPDGLARENRPRAHVIENPDDLFKLGIDFLPYAELNLDEYLFIPRH